MLKVPVFVGVNSITLSPELTVFLILNDDMTIDLEQPGVLDMSASILTGTYFLNSAGLST